MVRVNWELASGDQVEEFVAALLLLRHAGPGNRITPSRGDRGVDVRLVDPDGVRFFQVKRYARPLTSAQDSEVVRSWNTFLRDTVPTMAVKSWTLVCPWNPTNERLDWLQELTAGAGFPTDWMDRARLEALTAENPALVDFYFGDGGERLHRLLSDALRGGRDLPEASTAEDLLDAISSRLAGLSTALNEVDPFYRYELEIRAGRVDDESIETLMRRRSDSAFTEFAQLDADHYRIMRIIPRSPAAFILRPITSNITLEVASGSPDHAAVEDFINFGAPIADVPGTVTAVTGPPGIRQPTGEGRFTVLALPSTAASTPDLEVRLIDSEGEVLNTLDLVDVEIARGTRAAGMFIRGRDRGGALLFTLLMNGPDGNDEVRVDQQSVTGKTPGDVVTAFRFLTVMSMANGLLLAVRGGPPLTGPWDLAEIEPGPGPRNYLRLVEDLLEIQRHSLARVVVPDVQELSTEKVAEIRAVSQLLHGDKVEATWSELTLPAASLESVPPEEAEVPLVVIRPLTLAIDGQQIEFNRRRRAVYRSARLADPTSDTNAPTGGQIRFIPATTNRVVLDAISVPPSAGPAS